MMYANSGNLDTFIESRYSPSPASGAYPAHNADSPSPPLDAAEMTKLAASIADCRLMTVQVTKTYTQQEWRDDLKKILMTASFNLNHTVFLFSDSQVIKLHFFFILFIWHKISFGIQQHAYFR